MKSSQIMKDSGAINDKQTQKQLAPCHPSFCSSELLFLCVGGENALVVGLKGVGCALSVFSCTVLLQPVSPAKGLADRTEF